ncbi:MAG: SH3 domain-containing protein [Rhodobacteraceae bacterium]|nr:SH3 domain-containing protein [Paracoccaceae bacterium]
MLFRLTFLLCAGLFVAMYFAPNRPAPVPKQATPPPPATQEAAAPVRTAPPPAAEAAPETLPQAGSPTAPARTTSSRPAVSVPADEAGPDAAGLADTASGTAETEAGPDSADGAPFGAASAPDLADTGAADLTGLGLGRLGAGQTSDALSLSESVRNRTEAATSPAAAPAPQARGLLAPTGQGTAAPVGPVTGQRALVVATSVNLRAGPSTGAAVVGRVDFGDTVVVVTQNAAPGWTGIRDPATGQVAFISSQFIQVQP